MSRSGVQASALLSGERFEEHHQGIFFPMSNLMLDAEMGAEASSPKSSTRTNKYNLLELHTLYLNEACNS